ncbi:MAG: hypothetical protein OEU26_08120 [Candidatus Tectomicrobia bacterium]|nr:hypothetical protein [Candidatus Tectomicrobia bacterium]
MPSAKSRGAMPKEIESEWIEGIWNRIREHLETKRAQIVEDIVNYPPPIPACDQHYNYLLEQRVNLSQELRRLNTLVQDRSASQDEVKLIDEFLAASAYIQDEAEQDIRAACNDALSGAELC